MHEASDRERAAVGVFRRLPDELRKSITAIGKDTIPYLLVGEAGHRATGVMARIVARGRYSQYRGTPGVTFGGQRAVTSKGTWAKWLARPLEFGSDGRRYVNYPTHSRKGTEYWVLRRTSRQFMPDSNYQGKVITPAAEAIAEQVVALWVTAVEDAALTAFATVTEQDW
jgi:hypothetical protein